MLDSINLLYLFIKLSYLYSLVRIQIKFEPMKDHAVFLAFLYTIGVAFLSFVFIFSWQNWSWPPWQNRIAAPLVFPPPMAWVGETFLLSALYFRLMAKFDESALFWILLVLG